MRRSMTRFIDHESSARKAVSSMSPQRWPRIRDTWGCCCYLGSCVEEVQSGRSSRATWMTFQSCDFLMSVNFVGGDVITECWTFCIHMPREVMENRTGPEQRQWVLQWGRRRSERGSVSETGGPLTVKLTSCDPQHSTIAFLPVDSRNKESERFLVPGISPVNCEDNSGTLIFSPLLHTISLWEMSTGVGGKEHRWSYKVQNKEELMSVNAGYVGNTWSQSLGHRHWHWCFHVPRTTKRVVVQFAVKYQTDTFLLLCFSVIKN
jgi:hypothetical protein